MTRFAATNTCIYNQALSTCFLGFFYYNYIVDTGTAARNIRDNKAHTNLKKSSRTRSKVITIS